MSKVIYTTYFSNVKKLPAGLNPISIAVVTPSGFPGRNFPQLMPQGKLLSQIMSNEITLEEYAIKYNEQLARLDPHNIVRQLWENPVLVCYEGIGDFCHRHLVADWLCNAGYQVIEYIAA